MSTIARAMAHIDSTADERDELIAALDAIRNDVIALACENDQLREQLADSDARIAAAAECGYRLGFKAAKEDLA